MYHLSRKPIISAYLKSKRLERIGVVCRSVDKTNNIFIEILNEKRPKGHPTLKRADKLKTDLVKISLRTIIADGGDNYGWSGVVVPIEVAIVFRRLKNLKDKQ
jgi:hypothetical protein